jgi:hypothetical protein
MKLFQIALERQRALGHETLARTENYRIEAFLLLGHDMEAEVELAELRDHDHRRETEPDRESAAYRRFYAAELDRRRDLRSPQNFTDALEQMSDIPRMLCAQALARQRPRSLEEATTIIERALPAEPQAPGVLRLLVYLLEAWRDAVRPDALEPKGQPSAQSSPESPPTSSRPNDTSQPAIELRNERMLRQRRQETREAKDNESILEHCGIARKTQWSVLFPELRRPRSKALNVQELHSIFDRLPWTCSPRKSS